MNQKMNDNTQEIEKTIKTEKNTPHYKNFGAKEKELKSAKSERKIKELEKSLEELQFKNLNLLAEMENLKKRLERDRKEIISFSNISLLQELIPTIDMFKRALNAKNISPEIENWLKGFEMIKNNFNQILEGIGVKEIEVKKGDEYNAKYHEAIDAKYSDQVAKNNILEVNQIGYLLNDRLIRPASVVVSKGIELTEEKSIEKSIDEEESKNNK
ncbi:nucleotide exchange factor GrpE [Candidatus Hepatoplasma crinochetorum]|uniref:nucleotide exchange factor GrpE n=1 Tax=Candidatus Hepatoplasma crinochetorum TaxID=295596 RepID=UPI0030853FDC|nr:MAG: hypothetical protein HCTKY_3410 [Candidatus Hepatoplasma crinochetorum]